MKRKSAKKKHKKTTAVEVLVDEGFDINDYLRPDADGIPTAEGYLFIIDEYDLVLPESGVAFSKCLINKSQCACGKIIVTGRATFSDCVFTTCSPDDLKISCVSSMHDTLSVLNCKGSLEVVAERLPCHAYRGDCNISGGIHPILRVYGFSSVRVTESSLSDFVLDTITQNVYLATSTVDTFSMYRLDKIPVMIDGITATRNACIEQSVVSGLDVVNSDIGFLGFTYTTIFRLDTRLSKIKVLSAYASVCENHVAPVSDTITAAPDSVGFKQVPATLYKKVYLSKLFGRHSPDTVVLELHVPADALARANEYSKKIRVSAATPVKVYKIHCNECGRAVSLSPMKLPFMARLISTYDDKFVYRIGKEARPREPFDESRSECASGLHGFVDSMDAANY